jgi:hypothetical protein
MIRCGGARSIGGSTGVGLAIMMGEVLSLDEVASLTCGGMDDGSFGSIDDDDDAGGALLINESLDGGVRLLAAELVLAERVEVVSIAAGWTGTGSFG